MKVVVLVVAAVVLTTALLDLAARGNGAPDDVP
jgi:hypothetical protein